MYLRRSARVPAGAAFDHDLLSHKCGMTCGFAIHASWYRPHSKDAQSKCFADTFNAFRYMFSTARYRFRQLCMCSRASTCQKRQTCDNFPSSLFDRTCWNSSSPITKKICSTNRPREPGPPGSKSQGVPPPPFPISVSARPVCQLPCHSRLMTCLMIYSLTQTGKGQGRVGEGIRAIKDPLPTPCKRTCFV